MSGGQLKKQENTSPHQLPSCEKIVPRDISDQQEQHMASPSSETLEVGVYEYRKKDLLGKGVFGNAYLGNHINDKSNVVIRCVQLDESEDVKKKFKRDAEIVINNQRHKNIIKYLLHIEKGNNLYFIMEYCEHTSLEKYMKKINPDRKTKVIIMHQCADVLWYLHGRNPCIMHLSIQPAVVLLKDNANDPLVKLVDFQLAVYGHSGDELCGHEAYTAPEMSALETYNEKVDVFSMGCVFLAIIHFHEGSDDMQPYPEANLKGSSIQGQTRPLGVQLRQAQKSQKKVEIFMGKDHDKRWNFVRETTLLMLYLKPTDRCKAEDAKQRFQDIKMQY